MWQRILLTGAWGTTAGALAALLLNEMLGSILPGISPRMVLLAAAAIGCVVMWKLLGHGPARSADDGDEPDWRSDNVAPGEHRRVFAAFNAAEARIAAHQLTAAEIPHFIRNEGLTFLRGELPMDDCWVEVWVPQERADESKEVLDALASTGAAQGGDDEPSPTLTAQDALARRAMRTALIGLLLVPPLLHPFSISLALKALLHGGTLSAKGRWHTAIALAVSLTVIAGLLVMVSQLGLLPSFALTAVAP